MHFIRNLTKDDLPSLKKFIARQYHDKYVLLKDDFFAWQFKNNPRNFYPDYAMKIIELRSRVVGHNGLIPVSMKVFDQDVTAGIFVNLMVDEKCRGFGLGALLIKESMADFPVCYTTGYGLNTRSTYEKLGHWTDMGALRRFIKILDARKVGKLIGKEIVIRENSGGDFDVGNLKAINRFGGEIDEFWEKIKFKYPITINRNKEYLNWRYADHPMLPYQIFLYVVESEIKGYTVIRTEEFQDAGELYKIGRIIDFISTDECEEPLLQAIEQKLKNQQADLIDFFCSGNFHARSLLNQRFAENLEEPYNTIPMLFAPLDRRRRQINWIVYFRNYSNNNKEECVSPDNWYVTKGDGDQDRPNIPPIIPTYANPHTVS